MKSKLSLKIAFSILFITMTIISCEKWTTVMGGINWCHTEGRKLTEEEISIINFNQGDSIVLKNSEGNYFYLKCVSKKYDNILSRHYDYHCDDDTAINDYYLISAEYKTNIINRDSSYLSIYVQISTSPHYVEGNDPISEAKFIINCRSLQNGSLHYYWFGTTPHSDRLTTYPLECPNRYIDDEGCTPKFTMTFMESIDLNGKLFNDVYIFRTSQKDYWSLFYQYRDLDIVETIYYNYDYGIIKLEYRDIIYDYFEFHGI